MIKNGGSRCSILDFARLVWKWVLTERDRKCQELLAGSLGKPPFQLFSPETKTQNGLPALRQCSAAARNTSIAVPKCSLCRRAYDLPLAMISNQPLVFNHPRSVRKSWRASQFRPKYLGNFKVLANRLKSPVLPRARARSNFTINRPAALAARSSSSVVPLIA
jgi:hypothetical protein